MKAQLVVFIAICGLSASVLGQDRGFGKACKTDGSLDCQPLPDDPLRCAPTSGDDGICECATGMFNNDDQNRCVSPEGGVCTISSDDGFSKLCTQFSTCKTTETLQNVEGLCECDDDARHDPVTGHCKLIHDSDRCTRDDHCDNDAALDCRDNKCQCKDPNRHEYDVESKVCVSFEGGSCSTSGIGEPVCFKNMICNNDICTCIPPHRPDGAGFCGLPAREFNRPCKTDGSVPCLSLPGDPLCCIPTSDGSEDGVCGCEENMFNNVDLDRCVSPPGATCTISDDGSPSMITCTEFASCKKTETSEDEEGECECDADATPDSDTGYCKLTYNSERCTYNSDCNLKAHLVCHEGKCDCKDLKYHYWDRRTCVSYEGGSCDTNGIVEPRCRDDTMTCDNSVCTCTLPHQPDGHGLCGLPWGERCSVGSDCLYTLRCVDGTCECPPEQEYSQEKKSCTLRVGETCYAEGLPCIENSACIQGKCACNDGYEQHGNRRCGGLLQKSCSETNPCYDKGHLDCTGNTCVCKGNYIKEDPADSVCKGKVGQACLNLPVTDCVGGADCKDKVCTCRERTEEATDKSKCFALHNQFCPESERVVCSEDRHLGCDGRVCVCKNPADQIYDQEKDRCLARAGKACGASASNIGCVANSQCKDNKCECDSGHNVNDDGECSGAGSLVASMLLMAVAMAWHGRFF